MAEIKFDLSTLGLGENTYYVTVKARAEGYADSEPSNSVTYVVAAPDEPVTPEETYTISGTWYLTGLTSNDQESVTYDVAFTSNGTQYSSITIGDGAIKYDSVTVYEDTYAASGGMPSNWIDEAYLEITFDGEQTVSKDCYEWFTSHGIKETLKGYWRISEPSSEGGTGVAISSNEHLAVNFRTPLIGTGTDTYDRLRINYNNGWNLYYGSEVAEAEYDANRTPKWIDENYRLIEITSRIIDVENADDYEKRGQDLLSYLEAFGVKLIPFTIDDTTYYAEEGMTWNDWVVSEYNTGDWYTEGTVVNGTINDTFYQIEDVVSNDLIISHQAYSATHAVGSDD